MEIAGIQFPDNLYYDKKHGWARVEGNTIVQGMTNFGQKIAQEIVFVESPPVGRDVEQGQTFMSLESGKWVGRVEAMVSGKLAEVNEELEWEPNLINDDPFGEGWMVKIEMADSGELANLWKVDSPELKALIEEEAEKYAEFL
jgi:glycine cleavage system H protein